MKKEEILKEIQAIYRKGDTVACVTDEFKTFTKGNHYTIVNAGITEGEFRIHLINDSGINHFISECFIYDNFKVIIPTVYIKWDWQNGWIEGRD